MGKGGHNKIKSNTFDYKVLDITGWQREGYLNGSHSFNWKWTSSMGESREDISVYTETKHVRLAYTITDRWNGQKRDIDYTIALSWTPCNYGGQRAWFVCGCGRRVAKLYLKNDYFNCRHCQRLNYYSQQQSKSDQKLDSIRERICYIQKQLKVARPDHNICWLPKPKGMHYIKYEWLIDKMNKLQQEHEKVFISEAIKRFGMTF